MTFNHIPSLKMLTVRIADMIYQLSAFVILLSKRICCAPHSCFLWHKDVRVGVICFPKPSLVSAGPLCGHEKSLCLKIPVSCPSFIIHQSQDLRIQTSSQQAMFRSFWNGFSNEVSGQHITQGMDDYKKLSPQASIQGARP